MGEPTVSDQVNIRMAIVYALMAAIKPQPPPPGALNESHRYARAILEALDARGFEVVRKAKPK